MLKLSRIIFLAVAWVFFTGCSSSPSARYYTISPLTVQEQRSAAHGATDPVSVTVAPVEIPDYLDRLQIVTREGANGLRLAEFDRWGGSLAENITTVLVENLSGLLPSDRVFAYPRMPTEKPDYHLGVRVLRLDCLPGERVDLKVQWLITTGLDKQEVARRQAVFSEKVADSRYETMVDGVSRTIEQLSREISREIGSRPSGRNPGMAVR